MSSISKSVSLPFLIVLLLAVLLACSSLPLTTAQSSQSLGCYSCVVTACAAYNNGISPSLSIGSPSSADAAAECSTLNTDIGGFIATAQNATCAANVAALACDVVLVTNQTETSCNTSTIGVGTALGNATIFQQQCSAAVGCLGYVYEDEIVAAGACNSFQSFLSTIIAQPTPSTVPCALCNVTACHGLSTVGIEDVVIWASSSPGLTGSNCPAQNAISANFLASPAPGVSATVLHSFVCDATAESIKFITQDVCNAGLANGIFDEQLYENAAAQNLTWQEACEPSISHILNATVVSRLIASGFCTNPSLGLALYATNYLLGGSTNALPSPSSSSSSSSGVASMTTAASSSSASYAASSASSTMSFETTHSSTAVVVIRTVNAASTAHTSTSALVAAMVMLAAAML